MSTSRTDSRNQTETRWFYADSSNNPIGPISFEELKRLAKNGTIGFKTYVLPEGETEWLPFLKAIRKHFPRTPTDWSSRWTVCVALLLMPPLGLVLLWLSPRFRILGRISLSILTLCTTLPLSLLVLIALFASDGVNHRVSTSPPRQRPERNAELAVPTPIEATSRQIKISKLSQEEFAYAAKVSAALYSDMSSLLGEIKKTRDSFLSGADDAPRSWEIANRHRIQAVRIQKQAEEFRRRFEYSGVPFSHMGGTVGYPLSSGAIEIKFTALFLVDLFKLKGEMNESVNKLTQSISKVEQSLVELKEGLDGLDKVAGPVSEAQPNFAPLQINLGVMVNDNTKVSTDKDTLLAYLASQRKVNATDGDGVPDLLSASDLVAKDGETIITQIDPLNRLYRIRTTSKAGYVQELWVRYKAVKYTPETELSLKAGTLGVSHRADSVERRDEAKGEGGLKRRIAKAHGAWSYYDGVASIIEQLTMGVQTVEQAKSLLIFVAPGDVFEVTSTSPEHVFYMLQHPYNAPIQIAVQRTKGDFYGQGAPL